MAYEFSDANFQKEVLESDKVTLIDLWAEWCGPCRMMTPVIDELAKEYEGKAVVGKLNVDDNPKSPAQYNVRAIPNLIIFKGGSEVERVVGAVPKDQLVSTIKKVL